MPTKLLEIEVEDARKHGYSVKLIEANGYANIIFDDYPIPPGFNKQSTELLLKFPLSYPNGKPDMFWTDEDLTLENGNIPNQAKSVEPYEGKRRRRFSWHLKSWNPGKDNLFTYLEFVNRRLMQRC